MGLPVPGREELIPEIQDQALGREGLSRGPGGAGVLAAAALGAGDEVQEVFPREAVDGGDAEVLRPLQRHRLDDPGGRRPPQGNVDQGRQDVPAERVGDQGDEGEGQGRVPPPEEPVPEKLLLMRDPAERDGREPAARGPGAPRVGGGRDPQAFDEVTRHQDPEEEPEEEAVPFPVPWLPEALRPGEVPTGERHPGADRRRDPEGVHRERHEVEVEGPGQGRNPDVVLEGH